MESFSLQGISLSSLPSATAYHNNSNSNTSTTVNNQNPVAPYVSAINKYAQEKENTKKTLKQQLMELKREEEKQIDDDMRAKMMLDEMSPENYLKGKRSLEFAFERRIALVEWTKHELETVKEQTNNISTLIDKYENQLKYGDKDYASKALQLLNNALKVEFPEHIVQDPIFQIHNTFFNYYNKFCYRGASAQLDGLGDNITVENLGLDNLDKNPKNILNSLNKAISSVDDILEQIGNKYYAFFGKEIDNTSETTNAKSCDEIQKWLDYCIENDGLDNDKIGYFKIENSNLREDLKYQEIDKIFDIKHIDVYL